jgi:hypothetical protein
LYILNSFYSLKLYFMTLFNQAGNQSYNTGRKIRTGQVIPVRGGVYKQMWEKPVAADADELRASTVANKTTSTTWSTFSASIDYARNITVTTGGTTGDVKAGNIAITGTDIRGNTLTENIAVIANQNSTSTGSSAFATVTQVVVPAQDGLAAEFAIGVGDKFGLEKCLHFNTIGGNAGVGTGTTVSALTREGTAPTVVVNTQSVAGNTVNFHSAADPTKTYAVYMLTEDPSDPVQDEA